MAAKREEPVDRPGQEAPQPALVSVKGLSRDEAYALGKQLRKACPRNSHADWKPAPERPDAVQLVLEAEKGRMPELLPLRHGRMARSAFAFYREAALTMAYDLAPTPVSGVRVQCCGDAHLCNFGGFATPEGRAIFSINDLDETLPAPWEWDVKRLAASFVVACRDNGLPEEVGEDAVLTAVRSYRESMAEFAEMKALDLWYYMLESDELAEGIKDPALRKRVFARIQKERGRSIAEDVFPKLAERRGEKPTIKDQLPTIFHWEGHNPGEIQKALFDAFLIYRDSLAPAHRSLLDQYELHDAAIKVAGIGSVGTACWVFLLAAGDGDPLFLQAKEARASVLEPYAGASVYPNHGQRVVHGSRLMQPVSDVFLGWSQGPKRHFFFRQLRDIKISPKVETFGSAEMDLYATWCGRALALSHARAGMSVPISGYLGKSVAFDQALARFGVAYANQNEKDHAALKNAIKAGKVEAVFEDAKG